MGNPLVAEVQDSTTAISGIPILESIDETSKAIQSGDWAAGVLGAAGTALDALGMAMDPFGSILAAGVGWLMEHVGPLSDALDALTGNPDEIKAHSETWKNVGTELSSISADLAKMIEADTASWIGPAGDAYRTRGADTATLISGAQSAAEGASSGIGTAGEVVGAVRSLVRDIIAELVGHLISWALQVLFTLGIGLAWVVPQVVAAVAKTAAKIADITKKLVDAIRKLSPLLKKLTDSFGEASQALKNIKGGKVDKPDTVRSGPDTTPSDAPPTPKPPPGQSNGGGGGGSTSPSSSPDTPKSPPPNNSNGDGATTSSGAKTEPPPSPPQPKPNPTPEPPPASRGLDGPATTPSGAQGGSKGGAPGKGNGQDPAKTREQQSKPTEFDPIDVVTGDVLLTEDDLVVPGALGELITRNHVSSYRAGRWFGRSWASLVDERLEIAGGQVRYHSADAMELLFPVPVPGTEVSARYGPLRLLHADGPDYVLTDPGRGLHRRFTRVGDEHLLREVRTEDGEFVELDRAADGAPVLLRHSGGARIAFDTADGRVRAVRALSDSGDVPVAAYDYDQYGHLARRTNSTPRPTLYDHDADGRLLGWTDTNGAWFRYLYDHAGRCVRTVGDQGFFDGSLSYADGRTTTTDSLGHQKVFEYDEAGNLLAETDKLGGVVRREWGPHNLLVARSDQLGRRTEFEHDEAGILRAVRRPDGSRVLIVERTDTELLIEVTVDGRAFRRRYTAPVPDPYTEPLGVFEDIENLPLDEGRNPGPEPVAPELDLFGRARVLRTPAGQTTLSWTVEGKLRATIGPDGARQQWTYDGEGDVASHTDALNRVELTEHGPFGIVTATTDAAGARTTRRYDTELRLLAVTNPAGQTWEYTYDAEGRLVAQRDFDGRVTRCAYDAAGQLTSLVNPAGETVEYRYDALGNLLERISAGGTESYRYDPVGRLVHATGTDVELVLEHDEQGRVVRQTTGGRTTTFAYEDGSAIARRTPSGVDVQWVRGQDGLDTLTVAGATLSFQRDAAGRPVAVSAGANLLVQQEFDPAGRLAGQHTPAGQRRYHRRPDGSIAERVDPAGGARYEFDPVGRIAAVHSPAGVERYAYDVTGNLISSSPGTGVEAGPRQYAGGELRAAGAVRYAYDARGRLVQRTVTDPARGALTWAFTWDVQDRLTGVRTPDGSRWRYRYDALDRRVAKQRLDPAGGIAEQVEFTWDGNALVEARHTVGGVPAGTLTWVHHPDDERPVAQAFTAPDGTTRLAALVTDDVGTPVELVAADTGAVRPLRTSLFGLVRAGDGDATPLRFPGQYHDTETGLHYNVYRYYDPANGRYLSPDPLGLEPAPNPLTYVADPLTASDPLGLTGFGGSGSDRLAAKYAAQQGQQATQSGPPSSGGGKCKKQPRPRPGFNPMGGRPAKGGAAGGTGSAPPAAPGKFGQHQNSIDNPTGPKHPTGRTQSQAGALEDSKPQTLDGSKNYGDQGSKPKPGENTDVIELNDAARNGKLNPELQKQMDDMGLSKRDEPFIRGHLRNDNLGGPGTSDNLTPLSHNANSKMQGSFEGPLKNTDGWLNNMRDNLPSHEELAKKWGEKDAKTIREDLNKLEAEYNVGLSKDYKYPNSTNGFEQSLRDHLVLNAEWKHDLSDATKAYLAANPDKLNTMPMYPPAGTKLDTVTGEMKTPDGNVYNAAEAKAARRNEFRDILNDRLDAMDVD
ncbi:RHS repeat-associated core domain-containing protein [Amycolatopsis albispora]|uniref:RHS repeat-associated core domain-containing protein n=1 Tax=Amycolatopsis albispora TaxID=1804986 RepID=UPI001F2597F2|nr:RHS repeat-associated core domain-containing protein [Amycolatopsis albispora]